MRHPQESGGQPPVTVARQDTYTIGPDMKPSLHVVKHTIEAGQMPATRLLHQFKRGGTEVTVHNGGYVDGGSRYFDQYTDNIGLYIILKEQLLPHQQTTIEYTTAFNYSKPPSPDCRLRVGSAALRSLETTVIFDPGAQPQAVFWAEWSGCTDECPVNADTVQKYALEPVKDDPDGRQQVHKTLEEVRPGTVLGFYWEW